MQMELLGDTGVPVAEYGRQKRARGAVHLWAGTPIREVSPDDSQVMVLPGASPRPRTTSSTATWRAESVPMRPDLWRGRRSSDGGRESHGSLARWRRARQPSKICATAGGGGREGQRRPAPPPEDLWPSRACECCSPDWSWSAGAEEEIRTEGNQVGLRETFFFYLAVADHVISAKNRDKF
jgi:hypothetical protein